MAGPADLGNLAGKILPDAQQGAEIGAGIDHLDDAYGNCSIVIAARR
jgi:hypothetical protein